MGYAKEALAHYEHAARVGDFVAGLKNDGHIAHYEILEDGTVKSNVRFTTKDSGQRQEYASGMVRDTEEGKARFDLLFAEGLPYNAQMLTRFAEHMMRGAEKYSDRNWELAEGEEELARYKSSALRHLIQWLTGERDEDHAAAVMFNLLAAETLEWKMGRTL